MRPRYLYSLCFGIAFATIFGIRELMGWHGVGWMATSQLGTTSIASFLLAPLIAIALTPLNNRLLAYRKSQGRDILEEERYESESGMISLTPHDDHEVKPPKIGRKLY